MVVTALENLRKNAFWLVDFIKSKPVMKHYRDIAFIDQNPAHLEAARRKEKYLQDILQYAAKNTKFYSRFDPSSIENFPVLNKKAINDNREDILSPHFKAEQLHRVTTSGSTGVPFVVYQDPVKRYRHTADNIYYNEKAGFDLGTRLYYFRVWNNINMKNPIKKWMQNINAADISNLSLEHLKVLFEEMAKDGSTKSILSFASSLEGIEKAFKDDPALLRKLKLKTIMSMSETLPDHTRNFLRENCNCNVVSKYSNMENGFLGQQDPDSDHYALNTASYYLELLHPDNDTPVETGQMGRIVVTDLFNFAMPIIRYDTGDMAIMVNSPDGKQQYFKTIEGRKTDFIYNTAGQMISPHTITNSMWQFAGVLEQFQFIQMDANAYLLKVNLKDGKTFDEQLFRETASKYLGTDSNIKIEYVDEIPLLASGKRKKIVNLMQPK